MIEQSLGEITLPKNMVFCWSKRDQRATVWLQLAGIHVNLSHISEQTVNFIKQVKHSVNCDVLRVHIDHVGYDNPARFTAVYEDASMLMFDKLKFNHLEDHALSQYMLFRETYNEV